MDALKLRVEGVIFNPNGEILLARHAKSGLSYWVLPGGNVRFGEKLDDALCRELREEIAAKDACVKELMFLDEFIAPDADRHDVKAGFLVEIPDSSMSRLKSAVKEESIQEIRFFTATQIIMSTDTFYPAKEFFLQLIDFKFDDMKKSQP